MLFNRSHLLPLYDTPDGGGSATGGNNDLEARLAAAFNSIVQKQGGSQDAAGILLLQENKAYRDEIRQLKADLEAAKGKVPADGTVILAAEDAATWQAYKELGKPDELKGQKDEYTKLQRETLYRQAAEAHGYKPGVLGQLPGMGDLTIEVREVEHEGQKRPSAFIKNGDGQERPLPDYVKETWADFVPALTVTETQQQPGTPFPRQSAGGSPATQGSPADRYLERQRKAREGRKNPLTGE